MIDVCEDINKYMKVRQISAQDIRGIDILDILNRRYTFPKKFQIEDFIESMALEYPDAMKTLYSYKDDIIRISKFKEILNKYSHNPVVFHNPLIIDINKYKNKKNISSNFFLEKGRYRVVNSMKNVIVIEREKNVEEGIRLTFDEDIDSYVKKGDILDLMITRKLFVIYWDVVKVYKCIPNSMV